jgi:YD repeat-containing protein
MRLVKLAVMAGLGLFGATAVAQSTDYGNLAQEYSKLVSRASDVSHLDDRLFGDEVSLYSGGLSFTQTDVSLPGLGFPMAITRSFQVEERNGNLIWNNMAFGDWNLELPRLHGVFSTSRGWDVLSESVKRCSDPGDPADAMPSTADGALYGFFDGIEFWQGNKLTIPGAGSQELMMVSTANPTKPTGANYRWVTNNQWFLSCLDTTANNQPGEGFLAKGPDGTQIWFNHLATRRAPELRKPAGTSSGGLQSQSSSTETESASLDSQSTDSMSASAAAAPSGGVWILPRSEVSLLPTKIQDRFGNELNFTYSATVPGQLTKIEASDGRVLVLAYNADGRIQTVKDKVGAGARTWTYTYSTAGSLTGVNLPDGSNWSFNLEAMARFIAHASLGTQSDTCNNPPNFNTGSVSGSLTHPSGAVGAFDVAMRVHSRSYVTKACVQDSVGVTPIAYHALYPKSFTALTVTRKEITGPGLAPAVWTYSYSGGGSWSDCTSNCGGTVTTTVRTPTSAELVYTFGNRFQTDEGKLYRTQTNQVTVVGQTETITPLRDENTTFRTAPAGQPYPAKVGEIINIRGDWMAAKLQPVQQTTLGQQSVNFVLTNTAFDKFARPTTVVRSSSGVAGVAGGAYSRTESTLYYDDIAHWVLGQVETTTVAGKVAQQTTFHIDTALPTTISRFGKLQQSMVYNADGTLASVTDATGSADHTIKLDLWYRGVPQRIDYPGAVSETAVVNPTGTIASTTDELGFSHAYTYDPLGRLTKITYPTGGPTAWNATSRSFTRSSLGVYGLGAGHWRQVVTTGNAVTTTYYDAFWRPVVVETQPGGGGGKSIVVTRFDAAGRETFRSYPRASLSNFTDAGIEGVTTSYDALGRPTQVKQSSELNTLTTTTDYLDGFVTRVTNPRGFQTETNYQVFDTPSSDYPVKIISAKGESEQQTTTIARDPFGKPLSITRSGNGG